MIRVFYGEDRVKSLAAAKKILGGNYETVEGADLAASDLPAIFQGMSLFDAGARKILIRDLLSNRSVAGEVAKFADTKHEVVLLETKIDKRAAWYKDLSTKAEFKEFKIPENFGAVFDVFRTAKRDGARAVKMLREIEPKEDPVKFTGLLVSQALKDYAAQPGIHEKKVLKELAEVDMQMKTAKVEPWLLVESFLIRLSSL